MREFFIQYMPDVVVPVKDLIAAAEIPADCAVEPSAIDGELGACAVPQGIVAQGME